MFSVKGVAYSAKLSENYLPTLQLPSALQSILVSFSSLFWFYCFGQHRLLQSHVPIQLNYILNYVSRETYFLPDYGCTFKHF